MLQNALASERFWFEGMNMLSSSSPENTLYYFGHDRCSQESTMYCFGQEPKTHRRLKRTLFNRTKQDRKRIFEQILFFKAIYNTKTNNSLIFCQLDSCGRKRARKWRTKVPPENSWHLADRNFVHKHLVNVTNSTGHCKNTSVCYQQILAEILA